ncbi:MAG: hypothetical protein CVU84_10590 [Firmicutes bacterium HGW-Firmicutes-1]|nr:MAG: hypothetical protein CVU84_10590 [Firmicutes bacterium HGW-Firmicutes-1]
MKKILIVVLAVIILAGGTGGFYYAKVYANPYNRTLKAIQKSTEATSGDVTCKMKFTLVPEKYEEVTGMALTKDQEDMMNYANVLLEKTIFELNYKQQLNKKNPIDSKLQYSLSWLYDNEKLLDIMLGMDEEKFELLMPSLMEKTIFMNKTDIYDQMGLDMKDFDFEKYFSIIKDNEKLFNKVDQEEYYKIILDSFEDSITKGDSVSVALANGKKVKCREYTIEMNYEDMVKMMEDVKKQMEDDDALKEYIRVVALEVLQELNDSKDYEAFNLEKEEVEDAIDYLEDEDDFDDAYEEMMASFDDALVELDTMPESMDLDYTITYALDRKNNFRGMKMKMDSGFFAVDYDYVMNSINEKIDFVEYVDNEAINAMDLMEKDEDELYELLEDIVIDAGDKIIENKALDSMLTDMKDNSELLPSEYSSMLGSYIDEFQGNKEEFIELMIEQMLYSIQNPYGFDY